MWTSCQPRTFELYQANKSPKQLDERLRIMHRRLTPLIFTTLAGVPLAGALTNTPASAATVKASAKAHVYKGATVSTNWGPIQVAITVKSKKITNVKVTDPTHTARSQVLDDRAIPILIQETLSAQSARINEVSGATTISQAYISSLQAAVKSAHLA
jgi:uncharacterized protein with FMN-binding domain